MDATGLFDKFYIGVMSLYRIYCCKKSSKHYFKYLKNNDIPIQKLTIEEKKSVKKLWGGLGLLDYSTHTLIKSVTGNFDPKILPELVFRTGIELKLNHPTFKNSWSDKSYFDMFFPEIKFPRTIVRNISGQYLDHDYNPISKEDALNIVKPMKNYIIKPSIDNGFGRGVRLIENTDNHIKVFEDFKANFVIQEPFIQSELMNSFNKSSVNIVRIITLYINETVYSVSSALRVGGEGEVCDNTTTKDGKGMVIIGINKNGLLKEKAYYSNGTYITKLPNGIEFSGTPIPNYDKMERIAKSAHKKLPHFKFIGWDFILDENSEPAVMEYNIKGPGVIYYQFVNGPLFGEYTKDLIEWLKK